MASKWLRETLGFDLRVLGGTPSREGPGRLPL